MISWCLRRSQRQWRYAQCLGASIRRSTLRMTIQLPRKKFVFYNIWLLIWKSSSRLVATKCSTRAEALKVPYQNLKVMSRIHTAHPLLRTFKNLMITVKRQPHQVHRLKKSIQWHFKVDKEQFLQMSNMKSQFLSTTTKSNRSLIIKNCKKQFPKLKKCNCR